MDSIISVKNLSKDFRIPHEKKNTLKEHFISLFKKSTYEQFNALDNVSFEIRKGECIGIIGKNGSGKSTLLKILAGIYMASKGHVKVKGKISPFLELGVGFDPELSGKENIYLNAAVLGLSKKEIDKRFEEIVAFAELERFIDMKVKNYSSGMFVRLAFSVAIQVNADILLMDEVLAVGDSSFQEKCFRVFHKFKEQGKTIILVTHDTAAIRRFCDRCIFISKGKIIADGKTEEVIDKYIYEQGESKEAAENTVEKEEKKNKKSDININKKITFKSFKLFDKNNKESMVFCPADPLKCEIELDCNDKTIKSVNAGIAIYNEKGEHIFGEATSHRNLLIETKTGKFTIIIKKLPLLSGSYSITLALSNEDMSEHYDWWDKKIAFNVKNTTNKEGTINFETQWFSDEIDAINELLKINGEKSLNMGTSDEVLKEALFGESVEQRIKKYREIGVNIGNNVFIDYGVWIEPPYPKLVTIEEHVVISAFSKIIGHDSSLSNILGFPIKTAPVLLKKNCYLGNATIVLPGVTIGEAAIVGAGSVVTKSIPDKEIWAGCPAKKISDLDDFLKKNMQLIKLRPDLFKQVDSVYLPKDKKKIDRATLAHEYKNSVFLSEEIIDEIIDAADISIQDNILDIGSGDGLLCLKCHEKGARVKGIDFLKSNIELAKEKTRLDVFLEMDLKDIKKNLGEFNKIFIVNLLSELQPWERELLFGLIENITEKNTKIYIYEKKMDTQNIADWEISKEIKIEDKNLYILER